MKTRMKTAAAGVSGDAEEEAISGAGFTGLGSRLDVRRGREAWREAAGLPAGGKAVPRDAGNPERAGVGSRSHFLWADLSAVTNTECDPELQLFSTEKGQLSQTPQQ